MKRRLAIASMLAMALAAGSACAQGRGPAEGPGPGYGYGPGMMGGYGGGYGPGYGAGPGMMGGYGPGYGYGPGMMGGYGPGGRGGYGQGGPLALPDLSDEQREKLAALQEDNRRKNWEVMGQMRTEQFKLRRMYNADRLDSAALDAQQRKVDDLRRQMLKSHAEARNEMMGVLTPEQRRQIRRYGPWWLNDDDGG